MKASEMSLAKRSAAGGADVSRPFGANERVASKPSML
jgi:hypothetical protein